MGHMADSEAFVLPAAASGRRRLLSQPLEVATPGPRTTLVLVSGVRQEGVPRWPEWAGVRSPGWGLPLQGAAEGAFEVGLLAERGFSWGVTRGPSRGGWTKQQRSLTQ